MPFPLLLLRLLQLLSQPTATAVAAAAAADPAAAAAAAAADDDDDCFGVPAAADLLVGNRGELVGVEDDSKNVVSVALCGSSSVVVVMMGLLLEERERTVGASSGLLGLRGRGSCRLPS